MGTSLREGVRAIDFEARIGDYIDSLGYDFPLYNDTTLGDESISLARLPGGQTIQEYYDGIKDKQYIYELTVKAKQANRQLAVDTLGKITEMLEDLEELESSNSSFDFQKIEISNEVYFSEAKKEGIVYFKAHFQPILTIY